MPYRLVLLLAALLVAACAPTAPPPEAPHTDPVEAPSSERFDAAQLLDDLRTLSSAEMEGRRMGTPGHARAQTYLRQRFAEVGLAPFGDSLGVPFRYVPRGGTEEEDGTNFVGLIPGTEADAPYVFLIAHYDHLGIRDGEIYYGADDNASGTAALIAIADYLRRNPPRHPVVIAALDAEEVGLQGARWMAANPPVSLDSVALVVNMDMVSRSETDELYAVGTYHYPFLRPLIEAVASHAPITLLTGHDSPDLPPGDDWTTASDHGPFHERGVPFIYFGVEDHPGYHNPSDTFENITPDFYVRAVETVIAFLRIADTTLPTIRAARVGVAAPPVPGPSHATAEPSETEPALRFVFRTDRQEYVAGDTVQVMFSLVNEHGTPITISHPETPFFVWVIHEGNDITIDRDITLQQLTWQIQPGTSYGMIRLYDEPHPYKVELVALERPGRYELIGIARYRQYEGVITEQETLLNFDFRDIVQRDTLRLTVR